MVLPTIRASFDRRDALNLVDLLARHDPGLRDALLTDPDVQAPPSLMFYVLVRQTLLEGVIDSPSIADFVASVVLAFTRTERSYRVSEETEEDLHYLVEMIEQMRTAEERRTFLLRAHMGNYYLWLTGLFPDYLEPRVWRRSA